ncbi:MAG: NrfD/PsrC family molybdoenzyme membrane anchor subunit [Actinomycetota bacterium]
MGTPVATATSWRSGWTYKWTKTRVVLLALVGIAAGAYVYRFGFGLAETTNLSDRWPWGLWIWQVLGGVALTGAGFSTALYVHFAGRDEWKSIERAAFMTSLLGYLMVICVYPPELGRWFNFWRPAVFWGYHSALFEVYWCISLYTLVQVVKFGHIFVERVYMPRLGKVVDKAYAPLLVFGIVLPTLHHSSLGSLYVVAKGLLDPLWWSMLIPVFFLLSALFLGPAMVVVVLYLMGRGKREKLPMPQLSGLVRVSGWLMFVYLVLKFADLGARDQFGHLFDGSAQSIAWLVEIGLCAIVPMIVYLSKRLRENPVNLFTASVLVVLGVAFNRINVVLTGMAPSSGGVRYFPSWAELAVTIGIFAGGTLAYLFVAENFPILPKFAKAQAAAVVAEAEAVAAEAVAAPAMASGGVSTEPSSTEPEAVAGEGSAGA